MTIITLLMGAAMLAIGIALSIRAIRGAAVVGRVLRRPTLAVSRLQGGPVEVSGKVVPNGDALVSSSGQRCVAVKTTVHGRRSGIGELSSLGFKTAQRVVPARLIDATGECRLDLDLSEVVGERWLSNPIYETELARVPWADLVPLGSTEATIEEVIIPEGATVLVSGHATEDAKAPGSYRDGRGTEWVISGTTDHLLVLSLGGQARLVGKSVAIATFVLAVGAYLIALGGMMIVVAFSL